MFRVRNGSQLERFLLAAIVVGSGTVAAPNFAAAQTVVNFTGSSPISFSTNDGDALPYAGDVNATSAVSGDFGAGTLTIDSNVTAAGIPAVLFPVASSSPNCPTAACFLVPIGTGQDDETLNSAQVISNGVGSYPYTTLTLTTAGGTLSGNFSSLDIFATPGATAAEFEFDLPANTVSSTIAGIPTATALYLLVIGTTSSPVATQNTLIGFSDFESFTSMSLDWSAELSTVPISPSPVPIPASAWLLLSACGALALLSRRRVRAATAD